MVVTYERKTPRLRNIAEASASAFAEIASDYGWKGGGIIPVKTALRRTKFDRDIEQAAFARLLDMAGRGRDF